jgi:N-acetylglutamate synthase-like GNAT family acetyltransferase
MFCRGEFDFETDSRTSRSCDIKEICRLCMYWENTLLQLFRNSENLRDKIHAFCIVTEVSNCMSRMTCIFFPSISDVS